jgi:hypothetical protein
VPPIPLVDGVTIVDVVKSVAGPSTVSVPAGQTYLDIETPLSDAGPVTKVLAKCEDVTALKELGIKRVNGTCQIHTEEPALDLDLWVDGTTLHVGHKGTPLDGASVPMRPAALEIATGQWGFAIWGRGTEFAPQAKTTPNDVTGFNPMNALPLRLLGVLNELGVAAKQETLKEGPAIRFLVTIRTAFANPAAIADQLAAITGMDVLANTATAKAKPIAEANAGSLYAGDFAAGQHGMLLPTKFLQIVLQVGIPAILATRAGAQPPAETPVAPGQTPDAEQPAPASRTQLIVSKYASDVYPAYLQANPDKPCPTMKELAGFVSPDAVTDDEWGKPIVVLCGKELPAGAKGIALVSGGPDGKVGTADDLKSY